MDDKTPKNNVCFVCGNPWGQTLAIQKIMSRLVDPDKPVICATCAVDSAKPKETL